MVGKLLTRLIEEIRRLIWGTPLKQQPIAVVERSELGALFTVKRKDPRACYTWKFIPLYEVDRIPGAVLIFSCDHIGNRANLAPVEREDSLATHRLTLVLIGQVSHYKIWSGDYILTSTYEEDPDDRCGFATWWLSHVLAHKLLGKRYDKIFWQELTDQIVKHMPLEKLSGRKYPHLQAPSPLKKGAAKTKRKAKK